MSTESDLAEIRVLLQGISGEITLGEERLQAKLSTISYLESQARLVDKINKQNQELHGRITGLYVKVAGFAGIVVAIIELAIRTIQG